MSQQLISRSPDLNRLVAEGYALRIESNFLIVEEIPYLDADGNVRRGAFVCPFHSNGEMATPPAGDHVMWFSGAFPCDRHGHRLEALGMTSPSMQRVGELEINQAFSNKPRGASGPRDYRDFYEKVVTYEAIIMREVHAVDPSATSKVGALPATDAPDGPFIIPDTASARAGIADIGDQLSTEVVAIIGLGGTGSFIFDQVARSPVMEIHPFDGDKYYPHNVLRSPGTPSRGDLQPPPFKVDFHAERLGQIKRGIQPHPVYFTPENLNLLEIITFAFVSMDLGPFKRSIIEKLEALSIPYVEVGMGLHRSGDTIGGTLRAVLSHDANRDAVRPHIPLDAPGEDALYTNNIQIADLNSFNANMAIQLWKAHRGFYVNLGEDVWIYQLDTRTLIKVAA
ncbi:ThiF family adenylyltransferase [Hyphococcus sp. DH-69]|uniref:ThiF family adenylyltransferase n=1 Tax=Hyphococcus formosus TaxID=3143534 RepID=UPI00398AD626